MAQLVCNPEAGATNAPDAMANGDWSVSGGPNQMVFTIWREPANNGGAITSYEYTVDGTNYQTIPGATGPGVYLVTRSRGWLPNVQIAAVNSSGRGGQSDFKPARVLLPNAADDDQGTLSNVALTETRTSGTFPCGIFLMGSAVSSRSEVVIPFHDVYGHYSLGNPGNYSALVNNPIWGADRNRAYGWHTAASLDNIGTNTVTWTAFDGLSRITVQRSYQVADPNVVFAGADTACVSSAGNFDKAPAGASTFTTIAAAMAHLSGRQNQRLLIRFGETHTDTLDFDERTGSGRKLYISGFGDPADGLPLIDKSTTSGDGIDVTGNTWAEITIYLVHIDGGYDPSEPGSGAEPGGNGINLKGQNDDAPKAAHKTIHTCEVTNIGLTGIETGGTDGDVRTNLYVINTKVEGWYSYGIHGGDIGHSGISGCTVRQPFDSTNGSDQNTPPWWPRVTCVRWSRLHGPVAFSNNDVQGFNDWSSSTSSRSMQTLLRLHSGGNTATGVLEDIQITIDRLRGRGGAMQVYNSTGGGRGITRNFVLIDRLDLINTSHHVAALIIPMANTTVRNWVIRQPGSSPATATGMRRLISSKPNDTGANSTVVSGGQTGRSEVYSGCGGDWRTDAQATNRSGTAATKSFDFGTIDDISEWLFDTSTMLGYAPHLTGGPTAEDGTLDLAVMHTTAYEGERWQTTNADTAFGYGDELSCRLAPLAGHPAIGALTSGQKHSLYDFDGNERQAVLATLNRDTPSASAYEPFLEAA